MSSSSPLPPSENTTPATTTSSSNNTKKVFVDTTKPKFDRYFSANLGRTGRITSWMIAIGAVVRILIFA